MAKRPGCCCFLLLLLGLVGAAVAAFILWARPPSIDFKGVAPPEKNIPAFEMKELDNFRFNLRLNFTVKNPNYVGATLTSIQAKVDYVASKDKHLDTLFYIATKCGLLAEPKSQLKIKYTVNVSVKVVAVSVDLPPFDNDVNIDCPIPPGTKIPGLQYLALARGLIGPNSSANLPESLKALTSQVPPDLMTEAAKGITNNPKLKESITSLLGNSPFKA